MPRPVPVGGLQPEVAVGPLHVQVADILGVHGEGLDVTVGPRWARAVASRGPSARGRGRCPGHELCSTTAAPRPPRGWASSTTSAGGWSRAQAWPMHGYPLGLGRVSRATGWAESDRSTSDVFRESFQPRHRDNRRPGRARPDDSEGIGPAESIRSVPGARSGSGADARRPNTRRSRPRSWHGWSWDVRSRCGHSMILCHHSSARGQKKAGP
jgi:hypothetical protein